MSTQHTITLTYLNIRESIVILLAKLIATDVIFAFVVVGFYFLLVQVEVFDIFSSSNTVLFLVTFGIVGILKILLNTYSILQWLNEYYEITPENIVHKHGIIFRKSELYRLDHVRAMDVRDTFLGELLNFATITLYDIRLNKYLDMYLIHNPRRYERIIKTLRPQIERKSDRVRLPFLSKEENGVES